MENNGESDPDDSIINSGLHCSNPGHSVKVFPVSFRRWEPGKTGPTEKCTISTYVMHGRGHSGACTETYKDWSINGLRMARVIPRCPLGPSMQKTTPSYG